MRTKLKSVKFKALRSFAKEFKIDFPDCGMVLVRGKNLDTNGSSGSGKSSFLMALAYAFDYSPFPASSLQSWLTEEKMSVEVSLQTSAGDAVLRRGDKSFLLLNDQKTAGSAKAIAEKTQETIGLSPDMLAALTYRAQKKPGLFINKTDLEKKEFLSALLGLSKFEDSVEKAQENIKSLEQELGVQESLFQSELSTLEEAKAYFEKIEKELDASTLEAELRFAKQQIELISTELFQKQQKLESKQALLSSKLEQQKMLFRPSLDQLEAEISLLKSQKPTPAQDLEGANKIIALIQQCDQHILTVKEKEEQKKQEIGKHVNRLRKEISLMSERISHLQNLVSQKDEVHQKIAKLSDNVCPTCEQKWSNSKTELYNLQLIAHQIKQAEPELAFKKHEVKALEDSLENISQPYAPSDKLEKLLSIKNKLNLDLQSEKNKLYSQQQAAESEWKLKVLQSQNALAEQKKNNSEILQKLQSDLSSEISAIQQEIQQIVKQLSAQTSHENEVVAKLSQVSVHNQKILEQKKIADARLLKIRENISKLEQKTKELQAACMAEKDFINLCGREGFLGNIFDEVLSEISEETNRIMAMVPNVAHLSLAFRSDSVTQKGTTKKNIVPLITANGREIPLNSGCSGGMQTSVELAVDLAVAEVVSKRTGAVPGWLVLDECFEGLGTIEKEGCLEILQGYAKNRLVLVIDHASEFKEMFSKFIDIELKDGESFVTHQ